MSLHPRPGQPLTLGVLAALTAGLAAAAGLVVPDLYAPHTPPEFMPGAASQDMLTLAATTLSLWLTVRIRRGETRAWLPWLGLMGYFVYAYALYAFERVYNPIYPGYLAALGLALWAILTFLTGAGLRFVSAGPTPPRRALATVFSLLAALFLLLWLGIVLPASLSREPPRGNTIFVLDLVMMIPLLLVAARLLWRADPIGDTLALPLTVKMATLGLSVLLGALITPLWGQPFMLADVLIYAALGLGPLAFVPVLWRRLRVDPDTRTDKIPT